MMNDEQLAAFDSATAPKSPAEIAAATPFDQISPDLDRKVLNEIAKQNGITSDALNLSPSAFKKLNKEQLCAAIKKGAPSDEPTQTAPQSSTDQFDLIGFSVEAFQLSRDAIAKKDFRKLDGFVLENVGKAVAGGDVPLKIESNSKNLTYALVFGGILYGAARIVGFDTITEKAKSIGGKLLNFGAAKA